MKNSVLNLLVFGVLASGRAFAAQNTTIAKPAPDDRPRVQLAILLDTSGSMNGLIAQAKQQLWQIVNEFIAAKQDGQAPRVEVALYHYGNDGLSADQGFVQQLSPLTQDLDRLSEKLFGLSTNGGSEFCGWAIRDAVKELAWDTSPKVYKAIFIAGNEPFTQGPVKYHDACKAAVERGIVVNTIHCGDEAEGVRGKWKDGAALADGRFLVIDHNAQVANVVAPQDKDIAELNAKLNTTYLAYGRGGAEGKNRQTAQDANAASAPAPASVTAARAKTKASANYSNSQWDLVDAVKERKIDLAKLKDEELPDELRKVEPAKRAEVVEARQAERDEVQKRLLELSTEREKYVAQQRQQTDLKTLDRAVTSAIREQAAKKDFVFESK
jgi:von Willebrand factor type A domain